MHGPELVETQELLQEDHQEISPPSVAPTVTTDSENPSNGDPPSSSSQPDGGGGGGSDPQPSTSGIDSATCQDKDGCQGPDEEEEEDRQRRIMAALWKPRKSIATQLKGTTIPTINNRFVRNK